MWKPFLFLIAVVAVCQCLAEPAFAQKDKRGITSAERSKPQNENSTAETELDKGNAAFDRKEWSKATAYYTKALALKPDLMQALINRGRACLFEGKFEAAVADFRKACELNPDLAIAHTWLAAACLDKGDHAASIEAADRALKLDAKQALAWYVRGTAFIHKGELVKAIADLDEAARLNPNDPVIYNNRGIAHQKRGDDQKAKADFERRDDLNGKTVVVNDGASPEKQAAFQRMKQAEQQYKMINALVEAHENRIRTQQSIRIPPGVRRPVIEPVPPGLLQQRAAAWKVLQDANREYKQAQ
jgi:tetratricopeptide (TPR) repeat protein